MLRRPIIDIQLQQKLISTQCKTDRRELKSTCSLYIIRESENLVRVGRPSGVNRTTIQQWV